LAAKETVDDVAALELSGELFDADGSGSSNLDAEQRAEILRELGGSGYSLRRRERGHAM